jgi:hypothetical protein
MFYTSLATKGKCHSDANTDSDTDAYSDVVGCYANGRPNASPDTNARADADRQRLSE